MDLTPGTDAKAECHTERGMTFHKMHDFARAVKDLKQVCQLNSPPSKHAVCRHAMLTGPQMSIMLTAVSSTAESTVRL